MKKKGSVWSFRLTEKDRVTDLAGYRLTDKPNRWRNPKSGSVRSSRKSEIPEIGKIRKKSGNPRKSGNRYYVCSAFEASWRLDSAQHTVKWLKSTSFQQIIWMDMKWNTEIGNTGNQEIRNPKSEILGNRHVTVQSPTCLKSRAQHTVKSTSFQQIIWMDMNSSPPAYEPLYSRVTSDKNATASSLSTGLPPGKPTMIIGDIT